MIQLNSNEEFVSDKETSETVFNGVREIRDNNGDVVEDAASEDVFSKQPSEMSIVESDIQWGRTTLHKLLTNLGLL